MTALRIAAAKGYLLAEGVKLLAEIGISFDDDVTTTRQLVVPDTTGTVELMIVRPWDVPVFVADGACDLGIVGDDVLAEQLPDVATLLDLQFGGCRLVLAGPEAIDLDHLRHYSDIATKYPALTKQFFDRLGTKVTIKKLYGSIELAPLIGLSDYIVDLTATGQTLKENNLHIIETVLSSTARLIANPVSLKRQYTRIVAMVHALGAQLP